MLDILFQDPYIVVINKPHHLLVHASPIARNAEEFAIQILRDQIGQKVYPVHRLDRKTSGVLIFALDKTTNAVLTQQFTEKNVEKTYWAIVRGFAPKELFIDYPLSKDNGVLQDAQTSIKTLAYAEINVPFGKHNTSRYSLIEAKPLTGRMHQIRKHLAHILHPIIADRPHGCNKQNKLWLEKFNHNTMLLHAQSVKFMHPIHQTPMEINAPLSHDFLKALDVLEL